ncbi:MAG: S8 family serine peptidase [Vicinamibacteria bacterium]|nr:S8 family serine peptidase [Vicinamibacteria bacterium]
MKRFLVSLIVIPVLFFNQTAGASRAASSVVGASVLSAMDESPSVRVVVLFNGDDLSLTDLGARSQAIASRRDAVLDQIDPREFRVVDSFRNISAVGGFVTHEGLKKLVRDYRVQRIDLDIPGHMALAESTALVHARELQSTGVTGQGVVVAVLDTGIDSDHPDLQDDIVGQQCFCTNADGTGCCPGGGKEASGAGAAEDEQGHGTHVAGIITSGGRVAPQGMAPDADIVAIRVLDRNGVAATATQLVSAFDWIIAQPSIKVVNTSLVFGSYPAQCDQASAFTAALAQAVNTLRARGTLTVSSAGNSANKSEIGAPACVSQAIGVGAVYDANVGTISFGCTDGSTTADQVTCFSNSSVAVDLLAPGAAITSSGLGGGVAGFAGTSQAAPHVAGALALLLQIKPSATAAELEAALKNSGQPIADPANGLAVPRLDVRTAADLIRR